MKKVLILVTLALLVFATACSQNSKKREGRPLLDDATASNAGRGGDFSPMLSDSELNELIAKEYTEIVLAVTNKETKEITSAHIPLFGNRLIENTGLTVEVIEFYPDFIMTADGNKTTRSLEHNNMAANVIITGEDSKEFKGWLFANMPDIHPFEHPVYDIILVEVMHTTPNKD